MAQTVNEVMTADPRTVDLGAPLAEAAVQMRDGDIGAVLAVDGGEVKGIVTDRDIAVRAVAEGRDPATTPVSEICTSDVVTLTPDQSVDDALRLMQEHDVRRLPVVQEGRAAGIVSLGDVSKERDSGETLADISTSSPNN